MANKEQVSILKQGVEAWNGWRAKNIYVYADLNEADLNGVNLSGVDLRIAHLRRANLFRADLSGANLSGADLSDADFREANLSEAKLVKANLNGASLRGAFAKDANLSQANLLAANLRNANFSQANFSDASLMVANLSGSDLTGANLSRTNLTKAQLSGVLLCQADLSRARLSRTNLARANLVETKFIEADLDETNISEAQVGFTVFANSDLSKVRNLESLDHHGPSHISMDTLMLSKGKMPEIFLRGCGLSDADIEYTKLSSPALSIEEINQLLHKIQDLRRTQALQISPLFVAHSQADDRFVDKLGSHLARRGIRYWRDVPDRKARRREKQTAGGGNQIPTVLIVLSEHSLRSDWLENEVRMARVLEKETGRAVLYSVALDSSWKENRWPEQSLDSNILEFSGWKNDSKFTDMFRQLIERLELFHQG
jgi:uncharacterized protein YjbI with pentapeptide repeats